MAILIFGTQLTRAIQTGNDSAKPAETPGSMQGSTLAPKGPAFVPTRKIYENVIRLKVVGTGVRRIVPDDALEGEFDTAPSRTLSFRTYRFSPRSGFTVALRDLKGDEAAKLTLTEVVPNATPVEIDLPNGTAKTISPEANKRYSLTVFVTRRDGNKVVSREITTPGVSGTTTTNVPLVQTVDSYTMLLSTQRSNRTIDARGGIGYAFSGLVDHSFSLETIPDPTAGTPGGTPAGSTVKRIVTRDRDAFGTSSVIFAHFINSDSATHNIYRSLGLEKAFGLSDENSSLAFSFGTSGPDKEMPTAFYAGFSLFFGDNDNLGISAGFVAGSVRRLARGNPSLFPASAADADIRTENVRMCRPFIGISYKF